MLNFRAAEARVSEETPGLQEAHQHRLNLFSAGATQNLLFPFQSGSILRQRAWKRVSAEFVSSSLSLFFVLTSALYDRPVSATGDFCLQRLHKNRTVRLMKPQNKELSRGSYFKGTYGISFSRKAHFSFFIVLRNRGVKLRDFPFQSSVVSSCDDWSLLTNTTTNGINAAAVSAPSSPSSTAICCVLFDDA